MYEVKWRYRPLIFLVDLIGYLLFFWKKFRPFPKTIKKILVIRLDNIGDMVLTTPVFRTLKNNFPNVEVAVLCTPITKSIIQNNPNITSIFEFYSPWFSKEHYEGLSSFFDLIKKLRREKFDLVIELHADPRNIMLASLIGRYTAGYGVRGFGFLLHKVIHYRNRLEHIAQRNLDILGDFGIKTAKLKLDIFTDKKTERKVRELLLTKKIKSFVVMHPMTARSEKNWLSERWIELCDKLNQTIVFTGSEQDQKIINNIISKTKNKHVYNFAGELSLNELVSLIKLSHFVVTTDTLTTHIAAALDKNQVALFGPTHKDVWGPLSENAIVIQGRCKDIFGSILPTADKEGTWDCMKAIHVEDVINAIKRLGKDKI